MQFADLRLSKLSEVKSRELVVVLSEAKKLSNTRSYSKFPDEIKSRIVKALKKQKEAMKAGGSLSLPSIEEDEADLLLLALPEEEQSLFRIECLRDQLKAALKPNLKNAAVVFLEMRAIDEKAYAEFLGCAVAARIFQMPVFGKKEKEQKSYQLKNLAVVSSKSVKKEFDYGFETTEGSNLVRYLGTLPPNKLNSAHYGSEIRRLCRKHRLQIKFHSNAELKKMGAGAFTAVDQGDPNSKGGIYELSYSPSKVKNEKALVFVGKGLCFDTGGYDIKTGGHMVTMKGDMQGSAVALSSILTASRLKLPIKMKAFLGVTENHISPKAYKADEVITALNGTSIEIVNTDAEGRMVLADTLTLATKKPADLCIDFATLTGTAVFALGTRYSAGFTNRDEFHDSIVSAGRTSGERVWTFPLDKDYGKKLESPVADTLQCSRSRGGDHIYAAFFLSQFIENDTPWIHVDLAASENKGGLGATDTDFTGFGVRWAMEFVRKFYRLS